MDWIPATSPLIASLDWFLTHWLPIIGAPSILGFLALLYRRGAIPMGNARWQADKCLERERQLEEQRERDNKYAQERETYLTDRVTKLTEELANLHVLVDFLQEKTRADARPPTQMSQPAMTQAPTNSQER